VRFDRNTGAFTDVFIAAGTGGLGTNLTGLVFLSTAPTQPQALIVPGVGGTKLKETSSNGTLWLSNAVLTNDNATVAFILNSLAFDQNGNPITGITPGTLFNYDSSDLTCSSLLGWVFDLIGGAGKCDKTLFVYNTLQDSLQQSGYSPDSFGYDWRTGIGPLSEQLYAKVQSMIVKNPTRPVALIAHSMGGLIVGEMLRRHGSHLGSSLGPVITLGAPFLGSLKTYMLSQGADSLLPWPLLTGSDTKKIGGNWEVSYQLLPRFNFVRSLPADALASYQSIYDGTFNSKIFPPLPRKDNALPVAYSLWSVSSNIPIYSNAYAIVGYGKPTVTELAELSSLGCSQRFYPFKGDGDGTVPLSSAEGASWIAYANRRYINEEHLALPQNQDVIAAIRSVLQGQRPDNLKFSPQYGLLPDTVEFMACSPVQLTISDSKGNIFNAYKRYVDGAQYFSVGDTNQIWAPGGQNYTLALSGTGNGTMTVIVDKSNPTGSLSHLGVFNNVPVRIGSQGLVDVTDSGVGSLSYDYAGRGIVDTIPANIVPPRIQCTGCYFVIQGLRASLAFNIGYRGGVSTFSYTYRSTTTNVQFASTQTLQISVAGNAATFSGQGMLNGQPGYTFVVVAKDVGPAGSGLDTVSVTITGPNNYSYSANSRIAGGDIVVSNQ
jgi:pimeloyl-ACP methyl ester carboxylesterase